jgi:hypothetical protein
MKRLLLILALLLMVGGVQGLSLTFQQPEDFAAQVACTGTCTWVQNTTGGNSMVEVAWGDTIQSQTPLAMAYSAATCVDCNAAFAKLYDSAGNLLYSDGCGATHSYTRAEVKMVGGQAYIYTDGVTCTNSGVLAVNPSYVGWAGAYGAGKFIDDIIWGSAESKYIFGMPENGYFLMKDILNPAAAGFYRVNQTDPTGEPTLINSYSMASTFGKGSGDNEVVEMWSQSGGTKQYYSTGTAYAGQIYWNLSALFASDMQYGLVQTTIHDQVPSTGFPYVVSRTIPYVGSGANIQFDKNSYAVGETATLSVAMSPSYYAVVTSPHVVIRDIWGTVIYNQPITLTLSTDYVGTATYTWTTSEAEGVYIGSIEATYSGNNVMMGYATADLNNNLIVNGFVKSAETTSGISGATVNITQGITVNTVTSGVDGNYTSTATSFIANTPTTLAAAMTGYDSYTTTFTPLYGGAISINITLMPTTPTFSGVALGGIARTPPYNRTIDSATITITNANATYTVTTNSAGYYIKNNMRANEWWNIWGSKTGFGNSTTYNKLVVGI